MKTVLMTMLLGMLVAAPALGAEKAAPPVAAPPARSAVDPALAAEHTREDVERHRIMAAAHEAAAKCQESGKDEALCNAELARACRGIAYGKYCGMKHPD
jgi:hypothetical protein